MSLVHIIRIDGHFGPEFAVLSMFLKVSQFLYSDSSWNNIDYFRGSLNRIAKSAIYLLSAVTSQQSANPNVSLIFTTRSCINGSFSPQLPSRKLYLFQKQASQLPNPCMGLHNLHPTNVIILNAAIKLSHNSINLSLTLSPLRKSSIATTAVLAR